MARAHKPRGIESDLRHRSVPSPRFSTLLLGLSLAACALVLFGWLGGEVSDGDTHAFDGSIRTWIHAFSSPPLTQIVKAISFTGKVVFLSVVGTVIASVLIYKRLWEDLALLTTTMAGEIVLELVLKATYQRARPEPYFDLPLPESYSFPSGHALGSLCLYGVPAFIIIRSLRDPVKKLLIAFFTAFWILAVGLSRVYLGVHFPSDVLAGYLAGAVWMTAVIGTATYIRAKGYLD